MGCIWAGSKHGDSTFSTDTLRGQDLKPFETCPMDSSRQQCPLLHCGNPDCLGRQQHGDDAGPIGLGRGRGNAGPAQQEQTESSDLLRNWQLRCCR